MELIYLVVAHYSKENTLICHLISGFANLFSKRKSLFFHFFKNNGLS